MSFRFSNLPIFQKIMTIFSISFILFLALIFFYLLPQYEKIMLIEKKQGLNHNVELVYNFMVEMQEKVNKGELQLENARNNVISFVNSLRYQNGSNYFWIQDLQPKMIMHPINTNLNGANISDYSDPKGKKIFLEMAEQCKKN